VREEIAAVGDSDLIAAYEAACPPDHPWQGLDRYWRKRAEASRAASGS
jgi:hypothetical protein